MQTLAALQHIVILVALLFSRAHAWRPWNPWTGRAKIQTTYTEACDPICPAGFGCSEVLMQGGARNISACARCPAGFVSQDSSNVCVSCEFDEDMWKSNLKAFSRPSEDQSECVGDIGLWLFWNPGACVAAWVGLIVGVILFILYLFFIRETQLHRLLRKQRWEAALVEFNADTRKTSRTLVQKKNLLVHGGWDGKTPLQIALDAAPEEEQHSWTSTYGSREPSISLDELNLMSRVASHVQPPTSLTVTALMRGRLASETLGAILPGQGTSQDMAELSRLALLETMLDYKVVTAGSEADKISKLCLWLYSPRGLATVLIPLGGIYGAYVWGWPGSIGGAVFDRSVFVQSAMGDASTVALHQEGSECGNWCIAFTIVASLAGFGVGVAVAIVVGWLLGSMLSHLIQSGSDIKVVADSLTFFICVFGTWIFICFASLFSEWFTPFETALGGGGFGAGISVAVMLIISRRLASFVMKEENIFTRELERVLRSRKARLSTVGPLLETSLRTNGATALSKLIPARLVARKDTELDTKLTSRASTIVVSLASRGFSTDNRRDNILHALVNAHIAKVVDAVACASCIAAVVHRLPGLRRALDKNGETPAGLTLTSVFNRSVSEAVLLVLFNRFALESFEERIYESSTCRVYCAKDLETMQRVAIKLFVHEEHFEKERMMREKLGDHTEIGTAVVVEHECHDSASMLSEISKARAADELNQWKSLRLIPLLTSFSGGAIVMPVAEFNLHQRMSQIQLAGINASGCADILAQVANAITTLHQCGVVHGDVKPRNVVRINGVWKLIDMDAATAVGAPINSGADSFKWTSAFAAPELARCRVQRGTMDAAFAIDVFSFGILAYELCTGRRLFPQDICSNSMTSPLDLHRLCVWLNISDSTLDHVFGDLDATCSAEQRADARHLIRSCLQGDPACRISMDSLRKHRFLGGSEPPKPATEIVSTSHVDGTPLAPIAAHNSSRTRYHIFISHMQKEASGDVGTLFHLFEQMGVQGWRDMNQLDLTEAGMRQGVYDSDVFVLFLTNSVLSRFFCLKEITWALEFGKPIIIVVEEDPRFWLFDRNRWRNDQCEKTIGGAWEKCELQIPYAGCPAPIRDFIEAQWEGDSILPFRRRDFEVDALAHEIIRRASEHSNVVWGSHVPQTTSDNKLLITERRICFIVLPTAHTNEIAEECKASISCLSKSTTWTDTIEDATHVLMLLSRGCVDVDTASAAALAESSAAKKIINFLYIEPNGNNADEAWDFGAFYELHKMAPSLATRSVAAHEALKYRYATPRSKQYEHDALILELLARMSRRTLPR